MTGADLRAARSRLGLSQAALGKALDVPTNTIARWERGELAIQQPTVLQLAIEHLEHIATDPRPPGQRVTTRVGRTVRYKIEPITP